MTLTPPNVSAHSETYGWDIGLRLNLKGPHPASSSRDSLRTHRTHHGREPRTRTGSRRGARQVLRFYRQVYNSGSEFSRRHAEARGQKCSLHGNRCLTPSTRPGAGAGRSEAADGPAPPGPWQLLGFLGRVNFNVEIHFDSKCLPQCSVAGESRKGKTYLGSFRIHFWLFFNYFIKIK